MKKEQLNLDMSNFSYNVCFSYQVRAGAWLGIGVWPGGSKWETIIWSAAVENEDHDDEGDYLDLKEDDEKWSLWLCDQIRNYNLILRMIKNLADEAFKIFRR